MPRPSGPARLSLLYAVVFTEIGIAMPFMPLWLDALGLDARVIGVLLALPIATRIAATAPLMSLLDRGLGPRRLILLGSLALSLTYALMPAAAMPRTEATSPIDARTSPTNSLLMPMSA